MRIYSIIFFTIFFLLSCEENSDFVLWETYPDEIEENIPFFKFTENPNYLELISDNNINAYFYALFQDSIITQNTEVGGNKLETSIYAGFESSISNNILDFVQYNEMDMEFDQNRIWPFHLLEIDNYDIYSQENSIKFGKEKNEIGFRNPDKFENIKFDKNEYFVGDTIIICWENAEAKNHLTYNLQFSSMELTDSMPIILTGTKLINYFSQNNNGKIVLTPENYISEIDEKGDKHFAYLTLQNQEIRLENIDDKKTLVVSAYEQALWFVINKKGSNN